MNFHKTIGFLAALLLMVGIGVPDSFAQTDPAVDITLSRTNFVREGGSVDVTVTLTPKPAAGTTVTVSLTVATPAKAGAAPAEAYQATLDPTADPVVPIGTTAVPVEIIGPSGTNDVTLHIIEDEIYYHDGGTLTVSSASVTDTDADPDVVYPAVEGDDAAMLPIRENDDATGGDIKLTISPQSFSVGTVTSAAQTVTLTVELEEVPDADVTVDVVANLITGSGASATTVDLTPADITVATVDGSGDPNKKGTGPVELSTANDDNAGRVEVTVSSVGYVSAEVNIPVINRAAEDVEGFRITRVAPGAGAWAGAKGATSQFVRFNVTRVNRTQSYPWTTFQSIAVSLRDTSTAAHNIMTLTASSFTDQDGTIAVTKTVANSGVSGAATAAAGDYKITYNEPNDRFTFEFKLPKVTAANVVATLGSVTGEDTDGAADDTPDDNHPRAGDTVKGQRVGVYASVMFSDVDGVVGTLRSNDEKTKVFSNPTTPGADQTVGDGDLIKIDLLVPENIVMDDDLKVTRNNEDTSLDGQEAKAGDVVKAEVAIGSQTRFLRDGGIQIEFKTVKNTDDSGNANAKSLAKDTFDQSEISAAAGDALRFSLNLTPGKIKTPATAKKFTRDGEDLAAKAVFEPDNVMVDVLVTTRDQAGNASGAVSQRFTADTRAPGVHVLYPADGDRFTGDNGDTNWDEFLNPLRIRVDEEELDSLFVYADGTRTANDVTADNFIEMAAIVLKSPEVDMLDRGERAAPAGANTVGDTIIYNTGGLKYKKGNNKLSGTDAGGTSVDLKVVAVDQVGNRTVVTLDDVIHDQKPPTISDWFPRNDLLEDDDNQINDATRHPVVTLPEAVDSLSVTYDPSSGSDIVEEMGNLAKGEHQILISEAFDATKTYTLTIFARDLAGNAFETPREAATGLKFNDQFDNPKANAFKVWNFDPADLDENDALTYKAAKSDSVVAGQAFHLRIKALDKDGDDERDALTYKNVDENGNMASEVRISAWDGDGAASTVIFHGKGVMDNGDGSATLDAGNWFLGERTVWAKSNKTIDNLKIMVEHRNAGADGMSSVVAFSGAVEELTVDAADFQGFEITAWEDGVDGPASEVWGDFNLRVIPADRHGNPSVKAYSAAPAKGAAGAADSLNILDTRVKDNGINYKDGVDITLRSLPLDIGLPPFEWPIEVEGVTFPVTAPANAKQVSVQVRVDNTSLNADDTRSQNIKSNETFTVRAPLDLSLTLWVPGQDGDQAGNTVMIPAGESVNVTVRAEGLNEGDMVTFTSALGSVEVTADADGYAPLTVPLSGSGTASVTATSGQYSASLDVVYEELMGRRSYVDSNGDPVYLISDEDMIANTGDYLALLAAWGSSEGDANYNVQADVNDDGMVNIDDYLIFIASWGREAVGPASKPLVLLPGINENAEFSLSLGSERVVAGELMAVDVSLANVASLMGYGFTLNYETDKFEFVSVAPADEDFLTSTGGESKLFHHMVADGQVEVVNGVIHGSAVSGGGDIVRFVFRVLREFEDNARFEIANGLVFDPSQLQNPAVVAGVLELQSTPREFALHQNFPNPFNPDTTIKYDLAESADVTLQIYNVLGQVVRTLVASEVQNAGRYQIRWNGMDDRGVPVSSGIYFYQIAADGKFSDVRKLMLLK